MNVNDSIKKERKHEADVIIHTAAASAGAISGIAGLIPGGLLGAEFLLTGVTVAMVIKLGGLFNRSITKTAAKSILTVVSGMVAGKLALEGVVAWAPGIASIAGSTFSIAFHETAGWIIYEGFENGDW